MREEILRLIEKNSRIDIHEMAILLGAKEAEVANAIADMEKDTDSSVCWQRPLFGLPLSGCLIGCGILS